MTPPAPRQLLLVAIGGAIGAVARVALVSLRPAELTSIPWVTLAENLSGSLLLAMLLTVLGRRTTSDPTVRLLFGTGVLGSFTTYSTHSVEVVVRLDAGALGLAAGYLVLTVAGGLLAAGLGVALGRRLTPLPKEPTGRGDVAC